MTSQFKGYFGRTMDRWRETTSRFVAMNPHTDLSPFTFYSFTSALPPLENPSIMALGADEDIGGLSTSTATAVPTSCFYNEPKRRTPAAEPSTSSDLSSASSSAASSSSSLSFSSSSVAQEASSSSSHLKSNSNYGLRNGGQNAPGSGPHMSHVALHGNMSLRLPPQSMGRIRSGYVGMRNHFRTTVLGGEDVWDIRQYTHLKMQIAYRGWEGWRKRWYCNLQTAGPISTDVWQLRLDIPRSPASTSSQAPLDPLKGPPPRWTTLHLPISSFVLTNLGQTSATQIAPMQEGIRSIGFSLLGGGRDNEGLPVGRPGQNLSAVNRNFQDPFGPAMYNRNSSTSDGMGRGGGAEMGSFSQTEDQYQALAKAERANMRGGGIKEITSSYGEQGKSGGKDGVTVTPWSEGYYELCVRYVQAVNYDPMLDTRPSEWEEWDSKHLSIKQGSRKSDFDLE